MRGDSARLERAAARRRAATPTSRPSERWKLVQAAQRLGVVAVGGHHERAGVAVAGGQAR